MLQSQVFGVGMIPEEAKKDDIGFKQYLNFVGTGI